VLGLVGHVLVEIKFDLRIAAYFTRNLKALSYIIQIYGVEQSHMRTIEYSQNVESDERLAEYYSNLRRFNFLNGEG
jgi:hypothetical protein